VGREMKPEQVAHDLLVIHDEDRPVFSPRLSQVGTCAIRRRLMLGAPLRGVAELHHTAQRPWTPFRAGLTGRCCRPCSADCDRAYPTFPSGKPDR